MSQQSRVARASPEGIPWRSESGSHKTVATQRARPRGSRIDLRVGEAEAAKARSVRRCEWQVRPVERALAGRTDPRAKPGARNSARDLGSPLSTVGRGSRVPVRKDWFRKERPARDGTRRPRRSQDRNRGHPATGVTPGTWAKADQASDARKSDRPKCRKRRTEPD